MSGYACEFAAEAERQLDALLPDHRTLVVLKISQLLDSPKQFSRTAVSPPFPPGGMMCEFEDRTGGEWHVFTIFFRYGQDEETIVIRSIGHRHLETRPDRMGPPDPDNPFPPEIDPGPGE